MSARVAFKAGKSKVTDGPFTEAKEVAGGFDAAFFERPRCQSPDGKPSDESLHQKCFPSHAPAKASDYVYTHYAP